MRTHVLLVFLGCAAAAQAQPPKSYTPTNPPRPDQETILNARVVSADVPGSRLTVRGVDVKADGGRDETFTVAAPTAARLAELRPGMEVLLTLRGTTVVGVKVSVASGGEGGNVIRGAATRPAARRSGAAAGRAGKTGTIAGAAGSATVATPAPVVPVVVAVPPPAVTPQPMVTPQPVPTPQLVVSPPPTGAPVGIIYIANPSPAPAGTPFPTPLPVGTPVPAGSPRSVATPIPVVLPASPPPPTPTPSPGMP
jgi:hypothetical protein